MDNSLDVMTEVINRLSAFVPLTTLVPANSIYGVRPVAKPSWPFIRYGAPLVRPYEATCYNGAENIISIHAFAEGPDSVAISQIAAQIVAAMEDLTGTSVTFLDNRWTSTNIIPDNEEGSNWHAVVNFELTAVAVA